MVLHTLIPSKKITASIYGSSREVSFITRRLTVLPLWMSDTVCSPSGHSLTHERNIKVLPKMQGENKENTRNRTKTQNQELPFPFALTYDMVRDA